MQNQQQILTNTDRVTDRKTSNNQFWEKKPRSFCYLPTALCRLNLSFCWKESHPQFQGKIIATAVLDKDENCL